MISKMFEDIDLQSEVDVCQADATVRQDFADHLELKERLRKTLYFGRTPGMDCPSLPLTELAVEYFQESVPRELGRVDMYWASTVSRKACISPCAMMMGMLYIERLRHRNPEYIEKMSSEELFLISMMLASKYLYDEGVSEEVYNDEWAEAANLDLEDINILEQDFLSAMDWQLFVEDNDFENIVQLTEEGVALRQGLLRGYFSYSDLATLSRSSKVVSALWRILHDLSKIFALCCVMYGAGTVTLVSSASSSSIPNIHPDRFYPNMDLLSLPPLLYQQQMCTIHNQLSNPLVTHCGTKPSNFMSHKINNTEDEVMKIHTIPSLEELCSSTTDKDI